MAFTSMFPPDPFRRTYPSPGEGILVSNIPGEQPFGVSNHDFHQALPKLRTAPEALGRVLFSTSSGITYVAYALSDDHASATVAVIDGTDAYRPTGYHLSVSGRELEVAAARGYGNPGPAPKVPEYPTVLGSFTLQECDLDRGYEDRESGPFLSRRSPDNSLSLPNYLGNLPWKRGVADSMGKILHLHHLSTTVVPLRFALDRSLDCVILASDQLPAGTVVTATWDEIRTADWLPLDPISRKARS